MPESTVRSQLHASGTLRWVRDVWSEPGGTRSLEICANQVDEIFRQFWRNLLLGAVSEVEPDMGLEHLSHQSVHAAANGRQQHQLVAAVSVAVQGPLDGVELAAQFANSLDHFDGFALVVGHGAPLV